MPEVGCLNSGCVRPRQTNIAKSVNESPPPFLFSGSKRLATLGMKVTVYSDDLHSKVCIKIIQHLCFSTIVKLMLIINPCFQVKPPLTFKIWQCYNISTFTTIACRRWISRVTVDTTFLKIFTYKCA